MDRVSEASSQPIGNDYSPLCTMRSDDGVDIHTTVLYWRRAAQKVVNGPRGQDWLRFERGG